MSLNLNSIFSVGSLGYSATMDELYEEFVELDQEFFNLVNACEIAEKAIESQSTECMSFAEDLLDTSCEAVLTGSAAHIGRNAIRSMKVTYATVTSMRNAISSLKNSLSEGAGQKKVTITKYLDDASGGAANAGSVSFFGKTPDSRTIQVTLEHALGRAYDALGYVMTVLGNRGFGVPNGAAEEAKKFKRYLKGDKTGKIVSGSYANVRRGIAAVIKEARKIIQMAKREK